jgi:acyl carrier protein
MSKDVMDRLAGLIRETFSQPKAKINRDTLAEDIPGWDSLSHTILLLSVEEAFGARLPESVSYANVGELADAIARRRKA